MVCSFYSILDVYKPNKTNIINLFWLNVDIIKIILTEYGYLSQSSLLDKNINNIPPGKNADIINRDSLLIELDCFS